MGQHGNQQVHLAVGGGAQDGAQLCQEHGRVGQAPANGAQAQGGVQMRFVLGLSVQRFVGTDVDRADGDRQPLHAFDRTAVGLELLFFIGQLALATHEQKLAAEQAHTHRADRQRRGRVFGHFNVGQQLNLLTVQGQGRGVAQAGQALALDLCLALLETVLGQDDGRGVDDHHAGIAIDDDPVVLLDQVAGIARAHHGWNVEAARNDGSVRGLATDIGDKAGKHALLELQHVSRREVVRHQHQGHIEVVVQQQVLLSGAAGPLDRGLCGHGAGQALHAAQQPLDHLLEVALALAQVGVFHLVKLARHDFQLRGQRPLGVVQAVLDPVLDIVGQHFIL